jgi:hypothetical protein
MAPGKLKRHLTTNHSHLTSKVIIILSGYWNLKTHRVKLLLKKVTFSEKAQEASYLVAELTALKRKSHTVGENTIMPACKIVVRKC